MITELINIHTNIDLAINILSNGNPLAFPTETVFGIGADIYNINACQEIYKIKSRDYGKPLSAHVSSLAMAESVLDSPSDIFYKLAEKFLPGPLAIIAKKNNSVSDIITSGMNTISIRYPSNLECLKLISAFGSPIAATSANISGESALVNSEDVFKKFDGILSAVVEGTCELRTESTIISIVGIPKILRVGAIGKEIVEDFLSMKL